MKTFSKPPLTIDFTNAINPGPAGAGAIAAPILNEAIVKELKLALADNYRMRETGEIAWAELPHEAQAIADQSVVFAKTIRNDFENFVQMGIGGSALGAQAVLEAVGHPYANLTNQRPRMFVADNIDPDQLNGLFDVADPKKTCYHIVTKSGSTPETMAQLFIVLDRIKAAVGDNWRKHLYITTDPKVGALKKWAVEENLPTLHIPPKVGGRFSVLTSVGLLPAAVAGMDVYAMLEGAKWMQIRCWHENPEQNPAAWLAALLVRADRELGIKMFVMMPYSSRLYRMGDWFRQLWAESIGKRYDRDGKEIFVGTTPIKALGATDQHSQVQLYVEGPKDKLTIFVEAPFDGEVKIPIGLPGDKALAYLEGHGMGELLLTELRATERAIAKAGRPSITIKLSGHNPEAVGAFLYLWEVTTALAGSMYNINAFDQPGVEAGKITTAALLGKPGMEAEADAINKELAAFKKIVV